MTIYTTAVVLFFVFLGYYVVTARYLPHGAGPDSRAHFDVAKFIYNNKRLAAFPDDVDKLLITPYGTTRALRPPLSYLVSAGIAGLVHQPEEGDLYKDLRYGSGLLVALAAALVFIGLWLLYERYWLALAGALLFGLLPQLAFIASYTNDDSGAIFSGTALIFSMILVLRGGLTLRTAVIFGLATGLVCLSKFTAWLMLPLAACFLLPYLWKSRGSAPRTMVVIAICIVVGGGWWVLLNMARYGIDDPILTKLSHQMVARHADVKNPENRGFVSRGVGPSQLILHNYKNFIGESFKATVGNLDWLRLRLGWPQYLLYLVVFLLGILYLPLQLTTMKSGRFHLRGPHEVEGAAYFYTLLFLMVVFQIYMYIRFNLYHDVQTQGKYLLPAFFPVLILFSAALAGMIELISRRMQVPQPALKFTLVGLLLAVVIGTHVNALREYVLPYYFPSPLSFRMSKFRYLDLGKLDFLNQAVDVKLTVVDGGLLAESAGIDPQIELKPEYCEWLGTNSILHVVLAAADKGDFKIYIDEGTGYSESTVKGRLYFPGDNHIIIPFGVEGCRSIRLDPSSEAINVTIERVGFASILVSGN